MHTLIAIDVSGSAIHFWNTKKLQSFINQLTLHYNRVSVIFFDDKIVGNKEYYPDTIFEFPKRVMGGTSYDALFDWLEGEFCNNNKPSQIFVLTDGFAYSPTNCATPPFPVFWMFPKECEINTDFKANFGEVIVVEGFANQT